MHALTWHQSGGEPWAFSVSGQHHPQVLKSMEDAVRAARDTQPNTVVIRVGLTGLPGAPRSVTATMFTPCSNVAAAARQIAQLVELCKASTRSKEDPNRCAIAAMPEGTGNETGEVNQSHITRRDAGDGSSRDAGQRRTRPPEPSLSGHGEALRQFAKRAFRKRSDCRQRTEERPSNGPSGSH